MKITKAITGEEKAQENLSFVNNSVETENKNKKVLEHQFVTTS